MAACVVAMAAAPGAAVAQDPIMPLSELRPGMDCKGYSVVRGTEPDVFDVEILDVVDGDSGSDGPRILVRASGPAVESSGIGFGFSGSPIYCPGQGGQMKNAGAISESLGAYDGLTVLATPIETILANDADPPAAKPSAGRAAGRRQLGAALTVAGVPPRLGEMLMRATKNARRPVLAAPAGPLHPFPQVTLKPGSSVAVGFSTGAVSVSGIGTVSYVNGDRIWAFGHPFDGAGRRSLLLQDSYVYGVVAGATAESGGPYKLAAPGHDLGTISNDALTAVVGRTGPLPDIIPVNVVLRDLDSGAERTDLTRVADEASVGFPIGISPLSFVAPLALVNGGTILKGSPVRVSGNLCMRIRMRELPKGAKFCNRYVFGGTAGPQEGGLNLAAGLAATDAIEALTLIETYRFADLHVTRIDANLDLRRGARQAYMRKLRLPRRVRPGQRVRAKIDVTLVGGEKKTLTESFRIPRSARRGLADLTLVGTDSDDGAGDIFGSITTLIIGDDEEDDTGGQPSVRTVSKLAKEIRGIERWDGVRVRVDGRPRRGARAFRNKSYRLSGRATATVRVR